MQILSTSCRLPQKGLCKHEQAGKHCAALSDGRICTKKKEKGEEKSIPNKLNGKKVTFEKKRTEFIAPRCFNPKNDEESNRKANIASATRELEDKHAAVSYHKLCLDKQTENEQVSAEEGKQRATVLQNLLRGVKTSGE